MDAQRRILPEVLSIDEFYKARSSKYKYACMLYDFKSRKVIDVLTTRHKNYLSEYFSKISLHEKKRIKYVIIDMWESYRDTVKLCLPKALIAIDSFHLIKELNDKVSRIRIQVMNKYRLDDTSLISNDSNYYMLKKFSYFFMKDFDSITDKLITIPKLKTAWDKHTILNHLLSIDDTLKSVYLLKEKYRTFNRTARFETCDEELDDLILEFRNHELEEMRLFGRTLINWRDEIKYSFVRIDGKRLSNGPIEGANSQVKTIIKTSAGLHDFYRLRNRIMYALNKDIPVKNKEKDK